MILAVGCVRLTLSGTRINGINRKSVHLIHYSDSGIHGKYFKHPALGSRILEGVRARRAVFRVRVCLRVLNTVLYFFPLLSALFPKNYACKNWTLTKETFCSAKQ